MYNVDAGMVGVSYGRLGNDLPDMASVVQETWRRTTPRRSYGRGPVDYATVGAEKRGGVLLRDADPRRGRGERGVRGGQEPERAARPGHGQRARRAREAWPRHNREGVDADRVHRAQGVLAAVRGQVPG